MAFDPSFYLKKLTQFEALGQGLIKFCSWLWDLGGKVVRAFCTWFFGMRYGTIRKEIPDKTMDDLEPMLTDILERIAAQEREIETVTRHRDDAERQVRAFQMLGEPDMLSNAIARADSLDTQLHDLELVRAELDKELAGVKITVEKNKAEKERLALKKAAEDQTARDMEMYRRLKATALEIESAYDHKQKVEDCLEVAVFENEQMNATQIKLITPDKDGKTNYAATIKQVKPGMEAALFERALDCIRCRHVTSGSEFNKMDEAARQCTLIDFCAKFRLEEVTAKNVIKYCLGVSAIPAQWEVDNILTMYSAKAMHTRAVVSDARSALTPWVPKKDF